LLTDDPAFQESETTRVVLADKLIEARARTVLGALVSEKSVGRSLDIAVAGGKVTLSGGVAQAHDLANAVEKIRQIEGAKDVDNKVHRAALNYGV
jgi:osmotically-inducible protein OsmY